MSEKIVYTELRRSNLFCDAVLKVGNNEFPVHKIIVCGASSYFRAMFERWDHQKDGIFIIHGVSPDIMMMVLDFIYSRSITLSWRNIPALIQAADMFLLDSLVEAGFKHLRTELCPENCIMTWRLADLVVSPSTRILAWRFILQNFAGVMACELFLELTAQELMCIIQSDDLNVKHETTVFEAVVRWTNKALEERTVEFPRLLQKVRLSQMPFNYIQTDVINNELVSMNPECTNTVALHMQAAHEFHRNRRYHNPLIRPRLPGAILLAIGGWSGSNPTNAIEAYDYKTDRWLNVTNYHEKAKAYHGTLFFQGSVYCVGGFDRTEYFNGMRRLDLSNRTWHEVSPMYHRRCYLSVTILQDHIYAVGGHNGQSRLNSAEMFNPKTNQWTMIASMNENRSDASCTTLNNKIYICGGFNGTECLQTAECYCPDTNEWTAIAPMTSRRSGVAVIEYGNNIYAVGGFDGNVRLRSAEVYNPRTNSWQEVASMNSPRSNFGIEVVDDRIFAVGGFNGFTTTYEAEAYNPLQDTWTQICDMDIFRSALSCCVISGLPNMSDYTVSRDALPALDIETDSDEENNLD